jgi:hypothetical protein
MKYKVGQVVKFKWYNKLAGNPKILSGKLTKLFKNPTGYLQAEITCPRYVYGISAYNIVDLCTIATLKESRRYGKARTKNKNLNSI